MLAAYQKSFLQINSEIRCIQQECSVRFLIEILMQVQWEIKVMIISLTNHHFSANFSRSFRCNWACCIPHLIKSNERTKGRIFVSESTSFSFEEKLLQKKNSSSANYRHDDCSFNSKSEIESALCNFKSEDFLTVTHKFAGSHLYLFGLA